MEAEVLDSLWEVARQEQEKYKEGFVVHRTDYRDGGYTGSFLLRFKTIKEALDYFLVNEVVDGLSDPDDRILAFYYHQPVGEIIHLYAFYRDELFRAVTKLLAKQLITADFNFNLSRSTLEDYSPGIYPPSFEEEEEEDEVNVSIQDYTDADLDKYESLIGRANAYSPDFSRQSYQILDSIDGDQDQGETLLFTELSQMNHLGGWLNG